MADFADKLDFPLLLDKEVIKKIMENDDHPKRKKGINSVKINDGTESHNGDSQLEAINADFLRLYNPYEFIYGKCEESLFPDVYDKRVDQKGVPRGPFTKQIRCKLIYEILEAPLSRGGCQLEIGAWVYSGKLLGCFPTHDAEEADALDATALALTTLPWNIPMDDVKDYFGEKFALQIM